MVAAGTVVSASDLNMAPSGISMQSGDVMSVTLTYDGSNLTESVTDTNTAANFTHTYTGTQSSLDHRSNTALSDSAAELVSLLWMSI